LLILLLLLFLLRLLLLMLLFLRLLIIFLLYCTSSPPSSYVIPSLSPYPPAPPFIIFAFSLTSYSFSPCRLLFFFPLILFFLIHSCYLPSPPLRSFLKDHELYTGRLIVLKMNTETITVVSRMHHKFLINVASEKLFCYLHCTNSVVLHFPTGPLLSYINVGTYVLYIYTRLLPFILVQFQTRIKLQLSSIDSLCTYIFIYVYVLN
jgi:hypothetical protein